MDRRDALKKLGMGGVAVAGASVIISSPAFAFTVTPVTPTVTVNTLNSEKDAEFILGQANPSCGGSTNGTITRDSTFTASASRGTFTPALTAPAVELTPTLATTLSVPQQSNKFGSTDTARIVITTTFTCPYVGGDGIACRIYTFDFTFAPGSPKGNFVLDANRPTNDPCP